MESSQKSIVVIEFDYHSEVLLNSLLILRTLPFKIYLFTTVKIWNGISKSAGHENIIVFLAKNNHETKGLIKSNLELINSSETIIFNTLASKFKLFS